MADIYVQFAEQIYRECYGHLDDRVFHQEKVSEIRDWLKEGDPIPADYSLDRLVSEWREYAQDDPNLK